MGRKLRKSQEEPSRRPLPPGVQAMRHFRLCGLPASETRSSSCNSLTQDIFRLPLTSSTSALWALVPGLVSQLVLRFFRSSIWAFQPPGMSAAPTPPSPLPVCLQILPAFAHLEHTKTPDADGSREHDTSACSASLPRQGFEDIALTRKRVAISPRTETLSCSEGNNRRQTTQKVAPLVLPWFALIFEWLCTGISNRLVPLSSSWTAWSWFSSFCGHDVVVPKSPPARKRRPPPPPPEAKRSRHRSNGSALSRLPASWVQSSSTHIYIYIYIYI